MWNGVEEARLWDDRKKWRELVLKLEEENDDEDEMSGVASLILGDPRP